MSLSPLGVASAATSAPAAKPDYTKEACPPGSTPSAGFSDTSSSPFQGEIDCIAAYGVTSGKSATTYAPNETVLRQQMALFLYNLAATSKQGAPAGAYPCGFHDIDSVPANERNAICADNQAGIAQGTSSTQFDPGHAVRRDQMATFIVRLLAYEGLTITAPTGADYFTDDNGDSPHEANINKLASIGVVQGGSDGQYHPYASVTRGEMAAFMARALEVSIEHGAATSKYAAAPTTVSLGSATVTAGEDVTGTVSGTNIKKIAISGACLAADTTLDHTPSGQAEDISFSATTASDATPGSCDLTFAITYADGTNETITQSVTVEGPKPATSRPELVGARVLSTDATGSVVRYTFTEAVSSPVAASFRLYPYNWSGSDQVAGGSATANGSTIEVTFPTLTATSGQGASNVNNYTLATVTSGAVKDVDSETNPVGDASIGTQHTDYVNGASTPTLKAPSLNAFTVGAFDSSNGGTSADVTFQFGSAAWVQKPSGFHLVLTNNDVVDCQSAPVGAKGTTGNGNGTGSIVAGCDAGLGNVNDQIVQSDGTSNVARVYIDPNTVVSDDTNFSVVCTSQAGGPATYNGSTVYCNPIEAAEDSSGTNQALPDLTSASLTMAPTPSDNDVVIASFDAGAGLDTPPASSAQLFRVTKADGSSVPAIAIAKFTSKSVRLDFPRGTFVGMVGLSVQPAAVQYTDLSQRVHANQTDAVAATSNAQLVTVTPGEIPAPQLSGVSVSSTDGTATYTFDHTVTYAGGAFTSFRLYLADGTELVGGACNDVSTTKNTSVTCSNYTLNGSPASKAQVAAATLGTIDAGAVTGQDTGYSHKNPEGAEKV